MIPGEGVMIALMSGSGFCISLMSMSVLLSCVNIARPCIFPLSLYYFRCSLLAEIGVCICPVIMLTRALWLIGLEILLHEDADP